MRRLVLIFSLTALSWLNQDAGAAPCCASNAAIPSLIAGDHASQVSLSASNAAVIGDAPVSGLPIFRSDKDDENTRSLSLDAATLLSDRWQVGFGFSWLDRSVVMGNQGSSSAGVGDSRLSAAFEAWPEYGWSRLKPRGWMFAQLTLPTGRTLLESRDPLAADARGLGTWQLALGSMLSKRWSLWDAYLIPEVHASAARAFDSGASVGSSWGASLSVGSGVSPGAGVVRVGLRLQPTWRSSRAVRGSDSISGVSSEQLAWNTALETAWLVDDHWSAQATYIDQTLLGPALNSTLSRTVAFTLQRRWDR